MTPCYDVTGCHAENTECEEGEEEEDGGTTYQPCLFHQLYAPGFVCTRSNALQLAEWCSLNASLLDMNDPAVRAKTFVGWKLAKPSAKDVANSGFVRFSSTKDTTKCVYCGIALYQWEIGDIPDIDHDYESPFCKLLRYRWQLKRKEEEAKGLSTHSNKHSTPVGVQDSAADCACKPKPPTAAQEFYRRYGKTSDITLSALQALCKA